LKKISVIVATYNSAATVEKSLKSALDQTYDNMEIIIIDGGSTDSTIDLIKRYQDKRIYIISEPDDGIADAWNKGARLSSGDYVYFLNSDDYLPSDYFSCILHEISQSREPSIYFGNTWLVNIISGKTTKYLGGYNLISRYKGFGFFFTSVFLSRDALERVGEFNTKRRIAIDTDWLFRAEKHNVAFANHKQYNYMQSGGVSQRERVRAYKEYYEVMRENGYSPLLCWLYFQRLKLIVRLRSCFEKN
jgi:glycosyltransferase involved in cell wall biosynthesis